MKKKVIKNFSIVSFVDGKLKEKIISLQKQLYDITGSRKCLDAWLPHLTIGDGISLTSNKLEEMEKSISMFLKEQETFSISIKGFGSKTDRKGGLGEITTPYVLWINVDINHSLIKLVEKIKNDISSKCDLWYEMPKPYTPHITIAHRDLTKEWFEKGLKYLKNLDLNEEMKISHISLVEKLPDLDSEYKRFVFL